MQKCQEFPTTPRVICCRHRIVLGCLENQNVVWQASSERGTNFAMNVGRNASIYKVVVKLPR